MSTYICILKRIGRGAASTGLVLLLVVLMACGSDAPADEASVGTAVVAPTVAAAETSPNTAAESAATTEPTPVPPTEAPPTEIPSTEVPPAEAAAATPTLATAAETGALPAGDCGNVFYPVIEGRTLRYANTIPGFGNTEHTVTYSDVTDTSFTATTDLGDGNVLTQTWTCSGEGLLQPEFSQLPTAEEFTLTVEFVESSGLTIPAADQFQPGMTWTTHYVANATVSDAGAGEMTMAQTTDLTHTVVGPETITVPAGTFDALRVETTGNVSSVTSVGGVSVPPMELAMSFVSWYAEGIGLVRQDWSDLFGTGGEAATTELVAIE
jgi:hypothetical protein